MHYLYKITDTLNKKVYIGQSNREIERWRQHKYLSRQDEPLQYIHRAMKKYGIDNFTYEVIDFAQNRWQADCLEENYIQQFDSRNKEKGYNRAPGGNVAWQAGLPPEFYPMYGKHHSEESKRKSSVSNTGKKKPHTEEWRKQISDIMKGHVVTPEVRQKISQTQRMFSYEQELEIIRLRNSGTSVSSLSELYKCSKPTIYNLFKRHN